MKLVYSSFSHLHPTVQQLIAIIPAISARYYGCSCWLVGSSQHKEAKNPRDIDLVICIPDELFLAMYAGDSCDTIETWIDSVENWKSFNSFIWKEWSRDISKQGKELTLAVKKQVDFKTQPESYFSSFNKPKFKIFPIEE
jgi:hypothetical protein